MSPFDFEYCVILIYRLKVSDRAGDMQVTFSFHISCVGVNVFSLLKSVDGDILNTPLVPRFVPLGLYFLIFQTLTIVVSMTR